MRVALISPYSTGPMRGNITTVRRIARFLTLAGAEAAILPADTLTPLQMEQELAAFSPDIIHGFHARICGSLACRLAHRFYVPAVITITGTDLNDPFHRSHPSTEQALADAAAVVCFDSNSGKLLSNYFPGVAERLVFVPQGIEPLPLTGRLPVAIPDEDFVFLLPAALRPIKNVAFAINALVPFCSDRGRIKLIIAGGVLDADYASLIQKMLAASRCARWVGEVPYDQMGDLYGRADLVLNCSDSEEMPNSLLEAMVMGRGVLARDIPGNRSLIQDGETGWLYSDESDFQRHVLMLADDARLRAAVGEKARESVLQRFSPEREARLHIELYRSLAGC